MPSILAYFESIDRAETVKDVLQSKGIETIQIDRISEVPTEVRGEFNNPIANQGNSLAALTNTEGNNLGADVGVLLAASPASSGYGGDPVGSRNVLMTIVTSEDKIEDAVEVIKQNEGMV